MLDDIVGTYKFLTPLITNLSLPFEHNKWYIQYDGPTIKFEYKLGWNSVFGS